MSEEQTTTGAEAPPAVEPKPSDDGKKFDADYVKELREEAKARRLEAKALQDELEAIKQEKSAAETAKLEEQQKYQELAEKYKTEAETLKQRLEAEAKRVQEQAVHNAILSEAAKQSIADPDDAIRLLDLSHVEIQEDGTVNGVSEAVAKLIEAKPYLVKQHETASRKVNPTNPGAGGQPSSIAQQMKDYQAGRGSSFSPGGVIFHGDPNE